MMKGSSAERLTGLGAWLGGCVAYAWLGGFLLELFSGREAGAFDLLRMLVLYPLASLVVVLVVGWRFAVAERSGFVSALERHRGWLPWLLVPGVLDAVIGRFASHAAVGFVTWREALGSILTAGLWPRPLVSVGVSFALVGVSVALWRGLRRMGQANASAALSVGCAYFVAVLLMLGPSVLGWIGRGAVAGPNDAASVQRGLVRLNLEGYWWQQVYERFPLVTGGESALSTQYLLASMLFVLFAVAMLFIPPWRGMGWRRRLEVGLFSAGLPFLAATALGLGLAAAAGSTGRWVWADGVAWLVLAATALHAWLALVLQRDLVSLRDDETMRPDRPLISGEWRLEDVEEARMVHLALGLLGGWLLGLPVFFGVAGALLAGWLFLRERVRPLGQRMEVAWFVTASVSLFVATWFFAAGHGHVAPSLVRGAAGWLLGSLGWVLFLFPGFRRSIEVGVRPWVGGAGERVIPLVAVGLLFMAMPLAFASGMWSLLGLVFAAAGAVCLWQRETAEKRVLQLGALYAGLCGLLLASHWLIS